LENNSEELKKIIINIASVYLLDGVIRVDYNKGTTITLEDAVELEAALNKLVEGKGKLPSLGDFRNIRSINKEARDYFSNDNYTKNLTKGATLVDSPISKLFGNIFLGFNKLPIPYRIFTNEKEAIKWLKE
jgi:hypothetical protein